MEASKTHPTLHDSASSVPKQAASHTVLLNRLGHCDNYVFSVEF